MATNLSTKYGRKRAQANVAAAAAKAEKEAAERKARTAPAKPSSGTRHPEAVEAPVRDVSKLGNAIPAVAPDVTVTEEARRKAYTKELQNRLREEKLKRLVEQDKATRSEILHRKSVRASQGKKAKGALEKDDPVAMTDKEFETAAAEALGLRLKDAPKKEEMPWLPSDTSKKKGGYRREDFFGSWNTSKSSRFQGGYRDPAFRENFIESRMNGLKPGDAGYDRTYSAAKSAWSQAERQYDVRFREYGDSLLKAQRQKSIEQGGPVSLVSPSKDLAPNGVPVADIAAGVESAVASGARNVSVRVGNMTFSGGFGPSQPSGPKVGERVTKNGVYAGNGTYEFLKPGFRKERMA